MAASKNKPKSNKKKKVKSRVRRGSKSDKLKKQGVGRRTILTDELRNELVAVISAGNYYVTACDFVGVPQSTFYNWLKRGEEERIRIIELEIETGETQEPDEKELVYVEFLETIKKADAGAEISALLDIKKAYGESWQAAMTFLERRHSKRWRKKERLELAGSDGNAIQVHVYLPDNGRDNGNDDDNGEPKS